MIGIKVKTNLPQIMKGLDAIIQKQIPFAVAQALNKTGSRVQAAEKENIKTTFNSPTPFTQNSVGLRKARKSNMAVEIYVKDIAAAYLEPYETGGVHKLNGRALLNPKDVKLNGYGQLPRGMLAKLKAMPGVFIGPVKTKSGETVNGVWQRPILRGQDALLGKGLTVRQRNKMLRAKHPNLPKGANTTGKLKLLIRFGDALPVKKQLRFGSTAQKIVEQHFGSDFDAALTEALATAR